MSSIFKLNTLLFASVIGFITFQMDARAQDAAPEPLKPEIIDNINRITNTSLPSHVSLKMQGDVKFIESEGNQETEADKRGKRRHGEASSRMKSVIATKAIEMRDNRDEVLRQFDRQSAMLKAQGLGDRIGALDSQRRQVEERFAQFDEAMKRVEKADSKDYEQEVTKLNKLAKTFSPNHGDTDITPKPTPPNTTRGHRRPYEEPQHVSPPAYANPSMIMQGRIETPNVNPFMHNSDLQAGIKNKTAKVLLALNEYSNYATDTQGYAVLDAMSSNQSWLDSFSTQTFETAAVTPGPSCQSTAADLDKNTPEATVTPEIAALAQSLNYSPVKIFEYVSKNTRYEPYWGLLKGAQGTLVAGSGGASDQSALMIALMREAGYPARFVRGTVGFYNHGQTNPGLRWIGAKSFKAATDILSYSNNPTTSYTSTSMQMGHVWTEVCVPYTNYRGTQASTAGFHWVPLDPSFKDNTYQNGITHNTLFDYTSYMAMRTNTMPKDAYIPQVLAAIKNSPPNWSDNTIDDVPYKATQINTQYDILPSSLPYVVVSYDAWGAGLTSETSTLTESHRYKLVLTVKDGVNNVLLPSQTFRMSDIALKRLSLGWQGTTAGDQSLLTAWKNQSLTAGAPCATVNVRPELRLDGTLLVAGSAGGVGICTANNQLSMQILLATDTPNPYQVNATAQSNISAANVYALHAHAFQTSNRLIKERTERLLAKVQATTAPNTADDEILAEFLNLNILKWMRLSSDAARDIGALDAVNPIVGMHLGVTTAQMKIDYVFDLPFAVHRTGYLIDVGSFSLSPVDLTTGDFSMKDFRLIGYSASAYESNIWQETAHLDAVSTVRGLQYAKENNIEVLTLDATNWTTESVKLTSNTALNYSPTLVNSFYSRYIATGGTITLPRSLIQYGDWMGAVYLGEINTPGSEEGDYMIERFGGGATILTVQDYLDFHAYSDLTQMGYNLSYINDPLYEFYLGNPANAGYAAGMNSQIRINSLITTIPVTTNPVSTSLTCP